MKLWGYISNNSDKRFLRETVVRVLAPKEDSITLENSLTTSVDEFSKLFLVDEAPDMCCFDTIPLYALSILKQVRVAYSDIPLLLIADADTPPTDYIRPGILPTVLLIRPFTAKTAGIAFEELLYAAIDQTKRDDARYIVETRQGKQVFSCYEILFFEAREKKLFLNTQKDAYPFYSTLDNLEASLPEYFVRCHKSFIINKNRIQRIDVANNLVFLHGGISIPISRTYKAIIRGLRI